MSGLRQKETQDRFQKADIGFDIDVWLTKLLPWTTASYGGWLITTVADTQVPLTPVMQSAHLRGASVFLGSWVGRDR